MEAASTVASPKGVNINDGPDNQLVVFLFIIYVSVVVTVGSVGNLLTFCTIVRVKELRTAQFALIANLALTDVFNVLVCIPAFSFRFLFPSFYEEHETACRASAYLILILVTVSIITLQVIAANRYFIICQPRHIYLKYWNRFNTGIIITSIWFYCSLLACSPSFGFGEIAYTPEIGGCTIKENTPLSWWYKTILLLNVVESGITTSLFFILTFLKIRSTKLRLQSARGTTNRPNVQVNLNSRALSQEEIAVTKMAALVFFCFWLCWSPYFIFHLATIGKVKPGGVDTFLVIFALSNCVLNPFIYAGMNAKIRRAICRQCRVDRRDSQL